MKQQYFEKEEFLNYLIEKQNIYLVCGNSFLKNDLYRELEGRVNRITVFNNFNPNPEIKSIKEGIEIFKEAKTKVIVAIGGGSAIDVAKGIKAYCDLENIEEILIKEVVENEIELIAVPTTAGSGSESTHFSVVYVNGIKKSICHKSLLPSKVLLYSQLLEGLPEYQRKSTMLDAFCHAIESFWSPNASEESKLYSKKAIELILDSYKGYIGNARKSNEKILLAANYAGRAINITFTTAAHAMSYKLTTMYNISHGHAVALCIADLWEYMYKNDSDGKLSDTFRELSKIMHKDSVEEAIKLIKELLIEVDLKIPKVKKEEFDILVTAVDKNRLNNNPLKLEIDDCSKIYSQALKIDGIF